MATKNKTAEPTVEPAKVTVPAFKLTSTPSKVLLAYLTERVSGDADAPHRGLPFITEKGIVRVKPSDWTDWFASAEGHEGEPSKKDMLGVLKDTGLIQRVYPLPTVDGHPELEGKSFGLYTGPAPKGTEKLARRESARPAAKPAAEKPAANGEGKDAPAADAPTVPGFSSGFDVSRVPASELRVGDVIGTTSSDSRKAIEAHGDDVHVIVSITSNEFGSRVQARGSDGKIIRSLAGETKTWRGRTVAPATGEAA
jgi:hypothetical protein